MLTERIQVLVSPEQRALLERVAAAEGASVGSVVRDAIAAYTRPRRRSPQAAADAIFSLGAPVDEWDVMEAEIIRGATEGSHSRG